MHRIKAYFLLTRPVNVVIGGLSIFMGAFIAGSIQPMRNVLLAMASGALMAAAANAINDYFDINIDRINKPHRPLAAGHLSPREGYIFAMLLFVLGILAGSLISWRALVIATVAFLILYGYSARLKRTMLWGNLSVSFMTALAFIYGGVAVNRFYMSLIPAGFAFLFHLGREIIKDVEDKKGDIAENARTLPLVHGNRTAFIVVTAIFIVLIIATIMPFAFGIFGTTYLLVVTIGVDLVLIYVMVSMWRNPSPPNLGRLSTLLKMDMFVGLIAIYTGRF